MADITIILPNNEFQTPDDPDQVFEDVSDSDTYALIIRQVDGKNGFGAPIAPREITYTEWGRNWTTVDRDGRSPYLVMESKKLPRMAFTTTLARASDPLWDATGALKVLKALANTTVPLKITYGGYFESNYLWRCTKYEFTSLYRHPETHAITRADIDMEFTVLSDVVLGTGPLNGGDDPSPAPAPSPTPNPKPPGANVGKRKYKVKKGDTWHSLSKKFYGSTGYWRYLADLNKSAHAISGKTIKY